MPTLNTLYCHYLEGNGRIRSAISDSRMTELVHESRLQAREIGHNPQTKVEIRAASWLEILCPELVPWWFWESSP